MAKAKTAKRFVVAIGLNIGTKDGEVRYEAGDDIAAEHVENWMIEDGCIFDPDAVEVEVSVDSLDPHEGAALVMDALAAGGVVDEVGAGQSHDDDDVEGEA